MSNRLKNLKKQVNRKAKLSESEQVTTVSSTDNNSAEPKEVNRQGGVTNSGIKEFTPKKADMSGAGKTGRGATVKAVTRQEGSAAGKSEVGETHGTDTAVDGDNPVGREEGSAAGKKEVGEFHDLGGFRQKVRSAFGLSLDDSKNKGNNGIG